MTSTPVHLVEPAPDAAAHTGPSAIHGQPSVQHTSSMGYYMLEYVLVDDYLARRASFREAHLALAQEASARGDLVQAGALADPPDRAVLIWRTDDRSIVERFAEGDPYIRHGLVSSWTIRPWTVVIGAESDPAQVSAG